MVVVLLSAESSPLLLKLCDVSKLCQSSENWKFWNTLFFTTGSGVLLSTILFFVLSKYPSAQKEVAARRNLLRRYRNFKLRCINIFVVISGADQSLEHETLLSIDKFKEFFGTQKTTNNNYWHDVANNLSLYYLKLLNGHIEELRESIENLLKEFEVFDESDREQLELFSHHLRLMQIEGNDYDGVNSFCGAMWSIFTSWDFVHGYPEKDSIETLLTKI